MIIDSFDCQPTLRGKTLMVRPLKRGDLESLYEAASDPEIWAGHPAKDRCRREAFEPYFASLLASETALIVVDVHTGEVIGTSSYYTPPDLPRSIAIGFTFLVREKWGGQANCELKQLMLEHAFAVFDIVYFHIAPSNLRSQAATKKLGAVYLYQSTLKLSVSAEEWRCYGLTRSQWMLALGNHALGT